jgi:serine/threonine-protein kinase RsbW
MILTDSTEMETLNFASKGENITIIERLVDELCDKYSIQEEHYGNILIALTEGVNNAIYHGNRQDPDKHVRVSYKADEDVFWFRIEDDGPGFDFENVPDPTSPENLEKPNGRGVFLMRHLSDDLKFIEDGRIVEITFKNLSKPIPVDA